MSLFTPVAYRRIKPIPAVSPPAYPTSGLVLCLDNSAASYPGTGTTWYDVSGNGYDFTTVGSPTWSSTDGWDLNGSSQYLTGSSAATTGLNNIFTNTKAARNGLSIYARIIKDGTATADDTIFAGWTATTTKMLFEINNDRSFEAAVNTTPSGVTGGNTGGLVSSSVACVVGMEIASNGALNVYRENALLAGTPVATVPNENFANTTPWYRIGAREFPAGTTIGYFDGKIKGLMVYDRALDSTDRTSVYNYLSGL